MHGCTAVGLTVAALTSWLPLAEGCRVITYETAATTARAGACLLQ
jgi:hypothetical protein